MRFLRTRRWLCRINGHRIDPTQWHAFDFGYAWHCVRCDHAEEGWR